MAIRVPSAPAGSSKPVQTPASRTRQRWPTARSRAFTRAAWSTALVLVGIFSPSLGLAQSTNNGAGLCTAANIQYPRGLVRSGTGSTIIAWTDNRSGSSDVYAQRVSDGGQTAWQLDGVPVCTATGNQAVTSVVPDGAGGAILFWDDSRGGGYVIYAQRVDANGNSLWAPNGVPVCTATSDQFSASAISDGAGGALVCWTDRRNGGRDIYAQRVGADGLTIWASDGVPVCTAAGDQYSTKLLTDGGGGAIITWDDFRSGDGDIYAARISATGLTPWTADGVAVCAASGRQFGSTAVPDGLGGATIAWTDRRSAPDNVYAQRINADGLVLWSLNGIAVAPQGSGGQYVTALVADDAGGTILAWEDNRSGQDVFAQRLDGGGVTQWATGGMPICTAPEMQTAPLGVQDGSGGAIFMWTDRRTDLGDIFAQRIDYNGVARWAVDGVPVTTAPRSQYLTALVADGSGGAVATWFDMRTAPSDQSFYSYGDVYAQRVTANGSPTFPDSDSPRITGVRDVPNDEGGRVFVTWRASASDTLNVRSVAGYRVWRRIPSPSTGTAALAADGVVGREIVTLPEWRSGATGIEVTYWEAVATLPAERLQGYGYVAATTQDSIAGSNPHTAFFVTALTADPFIFYQSDVDSGYSVDNLSPPMPVPFIATYGGASNALHWTASRAPDMREFRLHRGASPDFVPDASNRILASRDTGYVDIPGAYYYKLSAVDIHGNVSRYAVVSPGSPTAALASLVSVEVQADRVRVVWYAGDHAGAQVTVYRRPVGTEWSAVAQVVADGTGYIRHDDPSVTAGARYGYRLGLMDGGLEVYSGEVWVDVPALKLALRGATPNPAVGGQLLVEFTLGGSGRARLELIDIAGRIVRTAEVSSLGPGTHSFELAGDSPLRPGIYFLRLRQSGEEVRARVAVVD